MPRAATAIIAIACSASYLGPDAGVVPVNALRCVTKKNGRARALSKRGLPKRPLVSQYETSGEQDEGLLARLAAWREMTTGIEAFGELDDITALPTSNAKARGKASYDAVPALDSLPEDLFMNALQFTGVEGRAVSRSAQRSCDALLHGDMMLPTFPLHVSVKQHYQFGPNRLVTTSWNLEVVAPSAPSTLEIETAADGDGEDEVMRHQMPQSGEHVLRLCRELRDLQTTLGVEHREKGRTQVEVVATDAAGKTFMNHAYERRIFCSKADDLLELLQEVDAPSLAPSSEQKASEGVEESRRATHAPRSRRARPASRSR